MTACSLLFGFLTFVALVRGDVDCSQQNACQDGNYKCSGEGCMIDCTGENSCEDSTFECTDSCTVDCSAQNTCENSEYTFDSGVVDVDCGSQEACESAKLIGKNDTVLSVNCNGQQSCESLTILMYDDATFSITCDGQQACESVKCICQDNSNCETSGDFECDDGYLKPKTLHNGKPFDQKKTAPNSPLKKMLGMWLLSLFCYVRFFFASFMCPFFFFVYLLFYL